MACKYDTCRVGICSVDNTGQVSCNCFTGFTGQFCDEKIDHCLNVECDAGQRCQDMISTYRCVDLLEETSSSDGDSDDVQGWVFALLAVGTIIGCMIWLVVYIQFSKGSLKETKRKMPRKKNLKKLKKGINWEHFEKSKQAERLAKINLLNSKWQIPQDEFQIRSTLDAGEFASIHAGLWNPSDGRQVALKRARDPLNLLIVSELQNEFEILTELTGNQNVIELLGITYMGDGEQPQLNIVFPLYHRGNLQTVLLELRDTESHGEPSGSRVGLVEIQRSGGQLVNFALDVARGMRHVASNGYVFRDLAARNVLVDNQGRCRICDFGMAKSTIPIPGEKAIEMSASVHQLPILWRWMAPESVSDNVYSTKTDVWQFGLVMWEIVTLGGLPYPEYSNTDVLSKCVTNNAYKMPKPVHCSNEWYTIMTGCWNRPGIRPSFQTLYRDLKAIKTSAKGVPELNKYKEENYIAVSPPAQE
ncbi:tyrosine kinase receptor Cad96Ca-like [Convolutriloba macropyga]|uniref:tyrosine kinase receptor Cad96Ca-like n=1 Tax=Convolutriloba macropyga TaxID=536237 RepID=UPI003F5233FC